MESENQPSGPRVDGQVIQAAAAGVQDAWDAIVDAYAGSVWASARQHGLAWHEARYVSQLTWLRLGDRLDDISPDAIGGWLDETVRRESTRIVRLPMLAEQGEAQPA
jgi:hypothetical protein